MSEWPPIVHTVTTMSRLMPVLPQDITVRNGFQVVSLLAPVRGFMALPNSMAT